MKYGIISDIHGNLEALLAVIPHILDLDKVIVLGDIVGYGPMPNECCEKVRGFSSIVVAGNHDLAAIFKKDIRWFNPYAKAAIEWTQRKLTRENKEWLALLPLKASLENLLFTHGSLRNYTDEYIFKEAEALANLSLLSNNEVLFVGHTHVPYVFLENDSLYTKSILENEVIFLSKSSKKCIINPGSVGQPRDFIEKASFGIYDDEKKAFRLYRIPYNIKRTQILMENEGLPEYLIKRLEKGR